MKQKLEPKVKMELVVTGKKDGIEEQLKKEKTDLKNMRKFQEDGKQFAQVLHLAKHRQSKEISNYPFGKENRSVPKGWKCESEKQTMCTPNNSKCG